MSDSLYISKLCEEKHKNIDIHLVEQDKHLAEHDKEIVELSKGNVSQAQINDILTKQLAVLEKKVTNIEEKPKRRADNVVNTVIQAATLLVLALLFQKIGLQ